MDVIVSVDGILGCYGTLFAVTILLLETNRISLFSKRVFLISF